jgi:hypothetical protein
MTVRIAVNDRLNAKNNCSALDGSVSLCVQECGLEKKFGPWANDLVDVGRKFSSIRRDQPTTLAITLPLLDFAAPLIAAGFVAEQTEGRLHGTVEDDPGASKRSKIFSDLCSLPSETPVLLRQPERTVHAVFDRVETLHNEDWAVIRFQTEAKGAGREFINRRNVHKVIFSTAVDSDADKNTIGIGVNTRFGLARAFIHDKMALAEFILRSSSDCVLVGILKTLTDELCGRVIIGSGLDGAPVQGTFQDIVRASLFLRAEDATHSKLMTTRAMALDEILLATKLTIFCGASAYINQVRKFQKSHHVVLLSQTERNFADAVAVLNEAFLHKHSELPSKGWKLPQGLEAMGFLRRPVKSR